MARVAAVSHGIRLARTAGALAALLLGGGAARAAADDAPLLGIATDAGVPAGVGLSAVYRPWRPLRLEGGATYDLMSFGVRAGATLVPLRAAVAPLVHAEVGHAFAGDASGVVGHFTTLSPAEQQGLRAVGFDWASAQLGVELGAPDRLVFFARAGVAWLWGTAGGFQGAVQAANPGARVVTSGDPSVRATLACASVGLLVYLR